MNPPIKLTDYPPAIRTALGMHEAMRRLEVSPDDIFVQLGADHEVCVVLGPFGFPCGNVHEKADADDVITLWQAAALRWNIPGPDIEAERQAVWGEFQASVDTLKLIEAVRRAHAAAKAPLQ